jgi:NAD(P)-dependent dehydrogenase (short-subunit alcohol dehydrogenase family)
VDQKKLSLFCLKGRVAIITGGAGMLGIQHAEAIAEAGGFPVLADIKEKDAIKFADKICQKYPVNSLGVKVDVTCKKDVENMRDVVLKKMGRVDILINNAANDPKMIDDVRKKNEKEWTRFESFSEEVWDQDLAVGIKGAFLCSQVLGDEMASQGKGTIINISSDLGIIAPDQRLYKKEGFLEDCQPVKPVTYSVVKTALIGLTRYLATYWAEQGVRVNALCPGGVESGQGEVFKEQLHSRIPMGRMAQKDEYKGAILFLASDASSYMTGSTLVVDGGRTCW